MPGTISLSTRVAERLRAEISAGERTAGTRLPSELELSRRFGVSRSTVRAALKELDLVGLVRTQHGVGTFVVEQPAVRAGLERMGSITDSIRASGKEPGMIYASRTARAVLPEEASAMSVPGDTQVLELRRTVLADGQVIAFSYDLIPMWVLPEDFDPETLSGSLFGFLRGVLGVLPARAEAEVHAVHSRHVGWGGEAAAHDLFVLLNQRHFDADDRLVLYSRTYFIEGRYSFTIMRSPNQPHPPGSIASTALATAAAGARSLDVVWT
jgi:GntR family transcriptional regulator